MFSKGLEVEVLARLGTNKIKLGCREPIGKTNKNEPYESHHEQTTAAAVIYKY